MTAREEFLAPITAPGIYHDVPMEDYIADALTPEPALSASGIRTLIESTPLAFAARNPRLWPFPFEYRERGGTKATKLGTAIHSLLLGKGQGICVINAADYSTSKGDAGKNLATKGAKAAIADAEANGLLWLTGAQNEAANRAAAYAEKRILADPTFGEAWSGADSEVTLIWQRETTYGPIWCRARPDRLTVSRGIIFDPKTTALSLDDNTLARKFAGEGTKYQAMWGMEGLETLCPQWAGTPPAGRAFAPRYEWAEPVQGKPEPPQRARFVMVAIEVVPPYDSRFLTFPPSTLQSIESKIDRACDLFALMLKTREFPGWPNGELPALPWDEREIYEELTEAVEEA